MLLFIKCLHPGLERLKSSEISGVYSLPIYLVENRDLIHTHFYKMKFLAVFSILLLVKKNEFGLCFSPLLSALTTKHVTSTNDEGKILFTAQRS